MKGKTERKELSFAQDIIRIQKKKKKKKLGTSDLVLVQNSLKQNLINYSLFSAFFRVEMWGLQGPAEAGSYELLRRCIQSFGMQFLDNLFILSNCRIGWKAEILILFV